LRDGTITLAFRSWTGPRARAGSEHQLDGDTALHIDSVERVRLRDITAASARRAGAPDREALLHELRRHARRPLRNDSLVYRIEFHAFQRVDPRQERADDASLTQEDVESLTEKLDKMDARSSHGPWTRETLRLISKRPAVRAPDLAAQLGRETPPFKANVRKLKHLGLTVSLDVGYKLSPRGEALMRKLRPRSRSS
jgi:hypothetical protein